MKSKRWHLPLGYRVRPRTLLFFIGGSVGVTAVVICLPLYLYLRDLKQGMPAALIPPSLTVKVESPDDLPLLVPPLADEGGAEIEEWTLDRILKKHQKVTGLIDTQSVLLFGTYKEDGRVFEMTLAAKAPNRIRKMLKDAAVVITCIFDGEVARVEVKRGEEQVSQVLDDLLYARAVVLEGALLSLSKAVGDVKAQYHLGKNQVYDGHDCWTIVSLIEGGAVINHLIDSDSGYERARYCDLTVDGQAHQISLHYSDYRPVGAFHYPHAYILKIDGDVRGLASIESIKYNSGLMPWMF